MRGTSTSSPARRYAVTVLQRLGLPGVVLLAAVLCDVAIVASASVGDVGGRGTDLVLLPGVVAVSACALWASRRPVPAAWAGAAVLVGSTVLLRSTTAPSYTTVLPNVSFAEVVAGAELIFCCVRLASVPTAAVTTVGLVASGVFATVVRDEGASGSTYSLVIGLGLLLVAVVPAVYQRRHAGDASRVDVGVLGEFGALLRSQWLLVGGLALLLFLDTDIAATPGRAGVVLLLGAAVAAVAAVFAVRCPVRAALVLAVVLATCTVAAAVLDTDPQPSYVSYGGFPLTAVVGGMTVSAMLVRLARPGHAAGAIALLSATVAGGVLLHAPSNGLDSVRGLAVTAALLLGMAMAIGLFLRARDSERTRTVEAAIADVQHAERMTLARELHDIVAHHVTGIVVQAQAARTVAAEDPHAAVDSLGRIEHAGADALTAMRRLVRGMRGEEAADTGDRDTVGSTVGEQATTDLAADLRRLAEANHGVPAELDLDLPADLAPEVARSALRIVQEALTNVGRHAIGAARVQVMVHGHRGELHVRVTDDGATPTPPVTDAAGGYGLIGMRERVDLLRGKLRTGPGQNGGWVVEAWLPLTGDETE